MELRHLRYFEAVAAAGNFTRAAERLGIAQPPLSRQIRELEVEMGAELFQRGTRPVALTPAGRVFYEQATQVLAGVEQLRRMMRRFVARGGRRFVVGFVGSAMYSTVPHLIRRFRERAPAVELELLEMTTLEQVAALREGRIDVGLGRIRIDDAAIHREVLVEEPLVVAVAAGAMPEAEADTETVALGAFAADTLVIYPSRPRPSYADQVLALFRDHGVRPDRVHEVRELQTALGLVAAGFGIALVPISVAQQARAGVAYRAVRDAGVTSPIIFSRRVEDRSPETLLFETLARAAWSRSAVAADAS